MIDESKNKYKRRNQFNFKNKIRIIIIDTTRNKYNTIIMKDHGSVKKQSWS